MTPKDPIKDDEEDAVTIASSKSSATSNTTNSTPTTRRKRGGGVRGGAGKGRDGSTTATRTSSSSSSSIKTHNVQIGPDLNISRTPFDKKEYRQILLENGLRVVLISDVVAMTQIHNEGGMYSDDDSDDEDEDEDEDAEGEDEAAGNPEKKNKSSPHFVCETTMAHDNHHHHHDRHHGDDTSTSSSDDDNERGSDDGSDDGSRSTSDSDDDDDEHSHGGDHHHGGGLRQAAAAMVVGVGTMYDPIECQGLAHFVERKSCAHAPAMISEISNIVVGALAFELDLLFMGSSKFPKENAYDSYLSKHGGSDNAYTELEYT